MNEVNVVALLIARVLPSSSDITILSPEAQRPAGQALVRPVLCQAVREEPRPRFGNLS